MYTTSPHILPFSLHNLLQSKDIPSCHSENLFSCSLHWTLSFGSNGHVSTFKLGGFHRPGILGPYPAKLGNLASITITNKKKFLFTKCDTSVAETERATLTVGGLTAGEFELLSYLNSVTINTSPLQAWPSHICHPHMLMIIHRPSTHICCHKNTLAITNSINLYG